MSSPPQPLNRIVVRFATFRDGSAADRSSLASELRATSADERVLIETCHRVELISVGGDVPEGAAIRGRDAVRRVLEVVGGFDSAIVAEEQLLGQVRDAYEKSLASGTTGPILNELLRRALRFGRRVRAHALPGTDRSLAARGVRWLTERIPDGSRVLVAGTGEMGRLAADELASIGHAVTISSRSQDRGERLVRHLRGTRAHRLHVGALDTRTVRSADGIVLAVRTRDPIVNVDMLADARPAVLDLAMPPALASDAAALLGDRAMTVDALGALGDHAPVLPPRAERRLRSELESEVDSFVAWLDTRQSADALALLHAEAHDIRHRHLERLRRRTPFAPEQVAAVDAASAAMIGELLHRPSVALRRGDADAQTVRRLFGLDPTRGVE